MQDIATRGFLVSLGRRSRIRVVSEGVREGAAEVPVPKAYALLQAEVVRAGRVTLTRAGLDALCAKVGTAWDFPLSCGGAGRPLGLPRRRLRGRAPLPPSWYNSCCVVLRCVKERPPLFGVAGCQQAATLTFIPNRELLGIWAKVLRLPNAIPTAVISRSRSFLGRFCYTDISVNPSRCTEQPTRRTRRSSCAPCWRTVGYNAWSRMDWFSLLTRCARHCTVVHDCMAP